MAFFNQLSALVGVNNTVIEFHLSVTSGSSRAQTWTARLIETLMTVLFPHPLHILYIIGKNAFCRTYFEKEQFSLTKNETKHGCELQNPPS